MALARRLPGRTIDIPTAKGRIVRSARNRERLRQHLTVLVEQVGPRPAGSPTNRTATDYLRAVLGELDVDIREAPFTTRWWEPTPCVLTYPDGRCIELLANPFSRPGEVRGPVVRIESRSAVLEHPGGLDGAVVVLGPALGSQPVMPTSFPFFMPDEHRELITALTALQPAAVLAESERHASMPMFEDPELAFPSLTVAPEVTRSLRDGNQVHITVCGTTHLGHGITVSARTGAATRRLAVSAHIDSKVTTPGAIDNAASVATLLVLAETASSDLGPVEFVFFNGEDHFDACGQMAWLANTDLSEIVGAVNLDGAGVVGRRTGVTCLACPKPVEDLIARAGEEADWTSMPAWYESDHAIFAMRGIPAVAVTSENVHELLASVAHTPADTLDLVDVDTLAGIVDTLRQLLPDLNATLRSPSGTH